MNKERQINLFSTIVVVYYVALLYLDCFAGRYTQTNQLKYGIIGMLFLETTFSLLGKGSQYLWEQWIWMIRLAVMIADFFFLFTPYNAAGIGCYLVVQIFYREKIRGIRKGKGEKTLWVHILSVTILLGGAGIYFGDKLLYLFGSLYAILLLGNLKIIWRSYPGGKSEVFFLALSLSFLALCDTCIFLNFFCDKEWISNLIWCFYIPSQFLLAKYE